MNFFALILFFSAGAGMLALAIQTYVNGEKASPYIGEGGSIFYLVCVLMTAATAVLYFGFYLIAIFKEFPMQNIVRTELFLMSLNVAAAGVFLLGTEEAAGRGYVAEYLRSAAGVQAEKERRAAECVAEEGRQRRVAEAEAARLKAQHEAETHRQEYEAKQRLKEEEFDIRKTKKRNERMEEERAFNDGSSGGLPEELDAMITRAEKMVYEFSRDGRNPTPLRRAVESLREARKLAA